jgi:hypothetical protein
VAASFGIHLSVVQPGPVAGEFVHKSRGPSGRSDDSPYTAARTRFQAVQDGGYETAQTNEEIAELIGRIAEEDTPKLRYQTSENVAKMVGMKLKDMSGERVTGFTRRWI